MKVKCPVCGKEVEWSRDNPFRPFCSERCKMVDLGEWASENRFIPGEKVEQEEDQEDNGQSSRYS